jgi:hypothetical protein
MTAAAQLAPLHRVAALGAAEGIAARSTLLQKPGMVRDLLLGFQIPNGRLTKILSLTKLRDQMTRVHLMRLNNARS